MRLRRVWASIEAAAHDYGVVLNPETLEIVEKGASRA